MALFQGANITEEHKIRPKELEIIIDDKDSKDDFVIIDVRDPKYDYNGGNIVHSVNIPFAVFLKSIDKYVDLYRDKNMIIFHCMYSKVRAPKVMQQYLQYIQKDDEKLQSQKVYLLVGGFRKWMDVYCGKNNKLIENLDLQYWKQDKYSKRWTHKNDW